MSDISIPAGHQALLVRLLALDDDGAAQLLATLKDTPPGLSLNGLADRLRAPATDLEESDLRPLVGMLVSMYQAMSRANERPTDFAATVVAAAKMFPEEAEAAVDWTRAERLIADLMALDKALGVSSKIIGVVGDHDHVYCRSRVLTDVRPVFSASVADGPAALVVVHTLRVTYHDDDRLDGFYVALDSKDLEDLRNQIDRALEKEKSEDHASLQATTCHQCIGGALDVGGRAVQSPRSPVGNNAEQGVATEGERWRDRALVPTSSEGGFRY